MSLWQISSGSVKSILSVILPYLVIENKNYTFPGVCFVTGEVIYREWRCNPFCWAFFLFCFVFLFYLFHLFPPVLRSTYICMIVGSLQKETIIWWEIWGVSLGCCNEKAILRIINQEKTADNLLHMTRVSTGSRSIILRYHLSPCPLQRALLCNMTCALDPLCRYLWWCSSIIHLESPLWIRFSFCFSSVF